MTVSELEGRNWTLFIKWFHKPQAGETSCQILLQGTWGLSWIRPGNSRDGVPTARITELQSWKGIQDLAGRQRRQQARERRTSRWRSREAKEAAADPRGAQGIRTPCWRVSGKSTGTQSPLFSWNYSMSLKQKEGSYTECPIGSRCFPSAGLVVSPTGCLLTQMGIKTFCEQWIVTINTLAPRKKTQDVGGTHSQLRAWNLD